MGRSGKPQQTTRKEIRHMISGKTAIKSRALAHAGAITASVTWLWLAAGLTNAFADSADVTENLYYRWGAIARDGQSLGVWADIDGNGTWETLVVFMTIHGFANPGQGTSCGTYDYYFDPFPYGPQSPAPPGQFVIWFVDRTAVGHDDNNSATWVFKSVPGIRLRSENDWIACTDTASPYYQVMAYTERGQGGTVVYNQTSGTGVTRTDEIRSQDGIKEVFIHTDSCENTLDCVVLLSGSDAEPYMLVTPVGGTANAGEDFTLSATAGGTSPLAYQWQLDGNDVAGATNSSLTLSNLTPRQAGSYRVVVTNLLGAVTSSVVTVTVPAALANALDTAHLTWTTGGGDGWYRTTASSSDGVDSATCLSPGLTPPYYQPWMQTTVTGPGTLTFWWIFPANVISSDYLTFSMDGVEQARIRMSLLPAWSERTYYVGAGNHTLRWAYLRLGSRPGGPARVDQVSFVAGETPAFITTQPASRQDVVAGTNVSFTVVASGTPPFTYQWRRNGTDLPGATSSSLTLTNVRPIQVGTYSVVVANGYGSPATSSDALLNVIPIPLPVALDCPSVAWATSGNENWHGQVGFTQDGTNAAQSGPITHSQQSVLETPVLGPGSVSFWWRVSSETNFDYLRFYINGVEQTKISGEVDWQLLSYALSPGNQNLRWAYTKDGSLSSGQDAGWVDQVSHIGPPTLSITRLTPPQLKVWWPLPATDWVLAQASPLNGSPTRWLQVPFPYETNDSEISVSLQPAAGVHGYRLFYWPRDGVGSGLVAFQNNASTAVRIIPSRVTVPTGTHYRAALYFAWDTGSSNVVPADSEFTQVGDAVGFVLPGVFDGGTRTVPVMVSGGFGWFQVRAWEAEVCGTIFTTYEAASHASPGCIPLLGESNKIRVDTGNPHAQPPENPASLVNWGLKGFYLSPF
jgi:hypothetical protein